MRITVLQDYLRRGGTERQSVLLCKEFHRAGHEVQLVTFRPRGPLTAELHDAGFKLNSLTARDLRLNFLAPGLVRQLRGRSDDIVLCMGRVANAFAGPLQRRLDATRVVGSVRTGKPLPHLNWRSFHRLPAVVTNTAWWKSQLLERGLAAPRIEIIPNGLSFDWPETQHACEGNAMRRTLGLTPDQYLLLNVAGFRKNKRQSELIDVLYNLRSRTDWQLVFVGDGPYRKKCERKVQAAGLSGRVHFAGWKDDPRPYYSAADIAVSLSIEDALPNFLIESQFMGVPVVAYAYRGVAEAIEQGRSGFACASREQFQQCLVELLDNQAKRELLGTQALEWARSRFNPKSSAAAYLRLFEDLLNAGAARV